MGATLTATRRTTGPAGGGPGGGSGSRGRGDGDGGGGFRAPLPSGTARLGMWLALAGISMMFIGLTSALVVRRGLDPGWRPIHIPALLYFNTAVLLASSASIEFARRRAWTGRAARKWLGLTLLMGVVFLGGQLAAWRQLAGEGVYLSTNPHSSFFYLLTGLHGLHILGGIAAVVYILSMFRDNPEDLIEAGAGSHRGLAIRQRQQRWVDVTALYWHFLGGLWVYLLALLLSGG